MLCYPTLCVQTKHICQGGESPSLRVCPWGREEGDVGLGCRGGRHRGEGGGRRSITSVRRRWLCRRGRVVAGAGLVAGHQGRDVQSGQEKVEVYLHLVPSGEDKKARRVAAAWTDPDIMVV